MNKAQVISRVEEVQEKIKRITGAIVGNKTAKREERARQIVGKAKAALGDLKNDLKSGT